jgi:hypothetical protein
MVEKTRRKQRGTNGWVIFNGYKSLGLVVNPKLDLDNEITACELYTDGDYSVAVGLYGTIEYTYASLDEMRKAGWRLYRANVHKK